MLVFIRMLYRFTVDVYDAVNVPLFDGIGFMDIAIGFLFLGLVVTVFWKGAKT